MSSGPTNTENPGSSKQQSMVRIHTAESTRVPGQWSSNQGKSILSVSLIAKHERETGLNSSTMQMNWQQRPVSQTLYDRLYSATALFNLRNLRSSVTLRIR
jgi:hypothetical protein